MGMNFKGPQFRNTNFTGDRQNPFRTKGYQIHEFGDRQNKMGSAYARPKIVRVYDQDGRTLLCLDLERSVVTVGGKIVYSQRAPDARPLTLKELRAEAARWCWKHLRYIPDALIPGRHVK